MHARPTRALTGVALSLLAIFGCSSSVDDERAANSSDPTTKSAVSDTCDPGTLAWNLGKPEPPHKCAGGVEVQMFNAPCEHDYVPGDPNCPIVDTPHNHQAPRSCNWADNASGSEIHHDLIPTRRVQVCCDPDMGWCPKPLCRWVNQPTTTCDAMWQAAVARYHSGAYAGMNAGQPFDWGADAKAVYQTTDGTYCDYDLWFLPSNMRWNQPSAYNCGSDTVNDPPTRSWPKCTTWNPDGTCNMCKTFPDDHSCGEKMSHLPFGSDLPASSTADLDTGKTFCLTDENNPINDTSRAVDVQAKYDRLVANLARAKAGTIDVVDDNLLAQKIVAQIKLLFEIEGDALSLASQKEAAKLYVDHADSANTPACGVGFTAPDTTRCTQPPASITALNADMQFCARLTSGHVNPAVRNLDVVKDTCIDRVATEIGALRASLMLHGKDDGTAGAVGTTSGDGGIDGGAGATDANDVCGFKSYRAQYDRFVTNAIVGRMQELRDPTNVADQPELTSRLTVMNRWYRALSTNLYPYKPAEPFAASVKAAAFAHAADVEGAFWQGVYRRLFPAGNVTAGDGGTINVGDGSPGLDGATSTPPTFDATKLAALVQDTLKADRAILKLLFPYDANATTQAPAPLDGAPLLLVMGDALEGMSQRLHSVGVYHDMGCAYLGCGPTVARSELVWLMQLLTDLPDAANLRTTLGAAANAKDQNNQPVVGADWLDVYTRVANRHAVLEGAVKDMQSGDSTWTYPTNGEALLSNAASGPTPKLAQHLAGLLQSARAATQTYKTTGLFNPTPRNRLPAGMAQETVDGIRADVQTRTQQLGAAHDKFDANLVQMAGAVIQELSAKGAMAHTVDQIRRKALDYDNTMADVSGLRSSLEANQNDFGTFVKAYSSLTAFDDNTLLQAKTYGPWPFDASSAKATGPVAFGADISGLATQKVMGLGKGTIVTVQVGVADKWSPTCALQTENTVSGGIQSPLAPGEHKIDLSDSLTGPEGYVINLTNGNAAIHSNQTGSASSSTSSAGIDAKICGGVHAQAGIDFLGNGSYGYVDISMCGNIGHTATWGSNDSDTNGQSQESRASMNFASGLRLPITPFPKAPVGALLAVITDKGNPHAWRDIRVIQAPATPIILSADSDVYLISNDVSASGCTANTLNKLNVSVSTAQHAGAALKWVQGGLASIAGYFDALAAGDPNTGLVSNAGSILAQGRLTPAQTATIRSTALVKLVGACNADTSVTDKTLCDPAKLPESVREFITNYIDREIERIDLKIEIMQAVRVLNGIGLDFQQMIDDYNAAQRQSRVAELVPQWTLRNLDNELLQTETAQLVNAVTFELYPVLQLRYPDVFSQGLAQDPVLRASMQTLVNAKWDAPVNTLAKAAVDAATELYNVTASLGTTYPPVTPKVLALAFSRPGLITHQWLTAADGRSAQVWQQATTGNHIATIRILPEDLYNAAGGLPSLRCTEQVPVLRDLAVVLSNSATPRPTGLLDSDEKMFTNKPITVSSWSAPRMEFPRARLLDANNNEFWPGGLLDFDLANTDWSSMDTQILVTVDPGLAMAKYIARPVPQGDDPRTYFSNARGLSPFGEFSVDFSALYNATQFPRLPVDAADNIIVILNVEYRQVSPDRAMHFISTCP